MPQEQRPVDAGEWGSIRRVSRWGNTRRVRRLVALLWIAALAIDPWAVMKLSRNIEALARLPQLLLATLTQLLLTWIAFRAMQIGLAQPPLTDSALLQFGADFDTLTEAERAELVRMRSRQLLMGKLERDEREAELQARAERQAYRLLRPGLGAVVALYWAVCLFGPFGAARRVLMMTAIVVTWLAVAVLVLPTMVRMWTQPDEVGEPRLVSDNTSE